MIEESSISVRALIIATMMAGCRRELPPTQSSTDPQTVIVTTSSTPDSQGPIVAASSTPDASSAPIASADTAPSVQFSSPKDSLCGEVAENGFRLDSRRKVVAAQLGRPDSVRSQPAPNPYNPAQTDTLMDVFYPGLRLHYAVLGRIEGETDILMQADVSNNRYLKYPQLGIGATVSEIVSALGDPEERTKDTYSYTCALHIMSGADVSFHFDGGRVKLVRYRWDID